MRQLCRSEKLVAPPISARIRAIGGRKPDIVPAYDKGILAGEPIPVFNRGEMVRDFTYVDDIVEGVVRVMDQPAMPDRAWDRLRPTPSTSQAPYRVYNIGNNRPVKLMRYIEVLEERLGKKAVLDLLPMQPGDVVATTADVSALSAATGSC